MNGIRWGEAGNPGPEAPEVRDRSNEISTGQSIIRVTHEAWKLTNNIMEEVHSTRQKAQIQQERKDILEKMKRETARWNNKKRTQEEHTEEEAYEEGEVIEQQSEKRSKSGKMEVIKRIKDLEEDMKKQIAEEMQNCPEGEDIKEEQLGRIKATLQKIADVINEWKPEQDQTQNHQQQEQDQGAAFERVPPAQGNDPSAERMESRRIQEERNRVRKARNKGQKRIQDK